MSTGIRWNSYGWDCLECGDYDTGVRAPAGDGRFWTDEENARLTKSAADHVCRPGSETGDYSDFARAGAYNVGVENPTLPPDDINPFDGMPMLNPPPAEQDPAAPDPTTPPEELFAGIERILRDDLTHAHKQWDKGPHEDYRLKQKDRVRGHPQRP